MSKSLRINALMLAMMLATGTTWAAGLGRLSVMSALGQPLKAEIELLSVQTEDLGGLSVKFASGEAFRQARLERSEALNNIRLRVEQRPDGQPVLRIASTMPISEPFMDMLIELNWSSGRILREYTILLDPPREASQAEPSSPPVAPVSQIREPAPKPADSQPKATDASPKPSAPVDKPVPSKPTPEKAAASEKKSTYGPVKSGETLRGIAGKVKHADVSLDMMIAGLYQANKQAFARDNMNLLKRGQTLNVPEQESLTRMFNPKQARALINDHGAAWKAYRDQIADSVAKTPAAPVADKKDGAAGKIVAAPAKDKVAPAPAPAQDVLKLSKGQPTPDAGVRQRQQALEEDIAAKGRALKEANERVVQLEKTVKDMQQLIKMKDQQAAVKPPSPEAKPAAPAPAPVATPKPEPAPAPQEAPKAPVNVAPPPIAEEPGFLASLLEKPLYIGGALAAILIAILGWFMLGRRRHVNLAQLEQNVINSGDDFKTAIFRTTAGATTQATTQQTSVMTDFSRLGLGAIDTHEVDPIAEAEVYMAYGRDAQAEEILKEALNKDPSRHEIALKLLEIYATRRDTVAFETQASEIYAALAGQPTPLWAKVTELGRSIDPDNPLYQFKGGAGVYPVAPEPEPYSPGADVLRQQPVYDESADMTIGDTPVQASADENASLENLFTDELDRPAPVPDKAEIDNDGVIDFQFDLEPPKPTTETMVAAPAPEPAVDDTAMPDFDIALAPSDAPDIGFGDMEVGTEGPSAMPAEEIFTSVASDVERMASQDAALPDIDFSGIDLELSEPMARAGEIEEIDVKPAPSDENEAAPETIDPELWEEVNTKLDLAKAYLEMGDKEGAREILDEVVKEGDRQQKKIASELIASA
jgi:pilus assembly protein FimV